MDRWLQAAMELIESAGAAMEPAQDSRNEKGKSQPTPDDDRTIVRGHRSSYTTINSSAAAVASVMGKEE